MYRVLVIHRRPQQLAGSLAGLDGLCIVATATDAAKGLRTAMHFKPDIAFLDIALPNTHGVHMLRDFRRLHPRTRCVLLTTFGAMCSAVDAIREGLCDYLEQPVRGEILREVIARVGPPPQTEAAARLHSEVHALARWAGVVVGGIHSQSDLRTLRDWGRYVGRSEGTLRNWCRTARLSTRRSLLFARMLRAVVRQEALGRPIAPGHMLDIVDRRTLVKLLTKSGSTLERLPEGVNVFLREQRLIDSAEAIAEVQRTLEQAMRSGKIESARADGTLSGGVPVRLHRLPASV
ncbi:MAG TPA: response regulator [Vicinamibacterales bacterium]|nr:response regulator [Vicinamibacterales bacterium]